MFDPTVFERRFGCGVSPRVSPLPSLEQVLSSLGEPDPSELQYPIEPYPRFLQRLEKRRKYGRLRIEKTGTPTEKTLRLKIENMAVKAREDAVHWGRQQMQRRIWTRNGFRERLVSFWGDHFTAIGKNGLSLRGMSPYIESGIRPHIAGKFSDLLFSATTHPLMLEYLDQVFSIGPNSKTAKAGTNPSSGLNENLAREVLELHTLGVDGPYSQTDVHELARLFTGLTSTSQKGFHFKKDNSEPGLKTVLGIPYGRSGPGRLDDVRAVLNDLAIHPATARHIAGKLVLHFLGDEAGPDIVARMTERFLDTGGDLVEVYGAMLSHPRAWDPAPAKVKQPIDFVASSLRALAPDPDVLSSYSRHFFKTRVLKPISMMGQPWEHPPGPDGWPEAGEVWISPQSLAARVQWAFAVPKSFQPDLPPGPDFLRAALGSESGSPVLRDALDRADTDWERVGLVLSSPEFQIV